jgi:dTDP-glucose pyrophosphorylase
MKTAVVMKMNNRIKTISGLCEYLTSNGIANCYIGNINKDTEHVISFWSDRYNQSFGITYNKQYSTKGVLAYFYDAEVYFSEEEFTKVLIQEMKKNGLNLKKVCRIVKK